MTRIDLPVGTETWSFSVRPEALVAPLEPTPAAANPRDLMRSALAAPVGLGAPLHRALTPDDRVTIVIDPQLPQLGELLAGIFEHLAEIRIAPAAVTLLAPPNSSDAWLMSLPDEYSDVTLETHDPNDRNKLSYLSTTTSERRLYLNRTLVDADAILVLTGRGFDPIRGYAGAESAIFPVLSDTATRSDLGGTFDSAPPDLRTPRLATDAAEVAWLLGTPFFIQVIEGPGDTIADVLTGLPQSTDEGIRRQNARWRSQVTRKPDLVVAAIAGDRNRTDFHRFASAAACGARIVKDGGRVVLLSTAAPDLPETVEYLRTQKNRVNAAKSLMKEPPSEAASAMLWLFATQGTQLTVGSRWPEELVTELYATPLPSREQLQAWIDAAESVLFIPDADKAMLE